MLNAPTKGGFHSQSVLDPSPSPASDEGRATLHQSDQHYSHFRQSNHSFEPRTAVDNENYSHRRQSNHSLDHIEPPTAVENDQYSHRRRPHHSLDHIEPPVVVANDIYSHRRPSNRSHDPIEPPIAVATAADFHDTDGGVASLLASNRQNQGDPLYYPQLTIVSLTKLRTWGRIAGLFYLLIIIGGLLSEFYVRGRLINYANAVETAKNIVQQPLLFRASIVVDVLIIWMEVCVSILIGVILTKGCNANPVSTWISMTLRLLQQAVNAANLLNLTAAALLLETSTAQLTSAYVLDSTLAVKEAENSGNDDATAVAAALGASSPTASVALAFFFLNIHKYGCLLALFFSGLSLFILGSISIFENALFPSFLGGLIVIAGCGYVSDSTLHFLYMGDYQGQLTAFFMLPIMVAEIAMTGFLCLATPIVIDKIWVTE